MQIFNVLLNLEPDKSCYAGNEAIVQDVSAQGFRLRRKKAASSGDQ